MGDKLKSEYLKERRRVRRFVRNARKRGYTINPSIWNRVINVEIGEITQGDLDVMRSLKPNVLYGYMEWINPVTNEIVPGIERRKQERRIAAIKGQFAKVYKYDYNTQYPTFTTIVLGNVFDAIRSFTPPIHWSDYYKQIKQYRLQTLTHLLNQVINQEGRNIVARRLYDYNEKTGDVDLLVEKILYKSESEDIQQSIVEFAQIIKGRALTLEESENFTDMVEMGFI